MTNQLLSKNQTPEIFFEDDDIIVCYKPAGIATQTKKFGQADMESLLKNYRASKKEVPYIGIIHRLDQPVEGVMVFAKNQTAAAALSKQVRQRTIGKHYYAAGVILNREDVAQGATEQLLLEAGTKGTLTDYIAFDKRNNISTIVPEKEAKQKDAKKAVLEYYVIAQKQDLQSQISYLIFDVTLHTGRHHQIRLQLANLGYPLIGDQKYGALSEQIGSQNSGVQLGLCSYRIAFAHPKTGKEMEFSIRPKNPLLQTETKE